MESEPLDDVFDRIRPWTDEQKAEELLRYFGVILNTMGDMELGLYAEHVRARQDGSPDEAMMLEIVEGQIALRQIRASR